MEIGARGPRAGGQRGAERALKASLRYCDGHLHRIDGEARKARGKTVEAQQEFTDAVTAFREAAELRPNWPDPFLGLARTFIYGLEDVDRGADALTQAQRLGYTPGDRETTQLADGYRARADTLAQDGSDAAPASHRSRTTSRGRRRRTGGRSTSTAKSSASPTSPARCG